MDIIFKLVIFRIHMSLPLVILRCDGAGLMAEHEAEEGYVRFLNSFSCAQISDVKVTAADFTHLLDLIQ